MTVWRADDRFGAVPASFDALLECVLVDFQQPAAIDLLIGYDASHEVLWFSERGEAGRAGIGMSSAGVPPSAGEIVDLAYWLQDQFFSETRGAWGEPRPRCPGHAHPMAPVIIGGEAWWTCPLDDSAVVRIGTFHS